MSFYACYLGKREIATGKVGLAGPYDGEGRAISLMGSTLSFACVLHEAAVCLVEEEMADDLRGQLAHGNWDGGKAPESLRVMPMEALSGKTPFKCAYVPAFDVIGRSDDGVYFTDKLSDAQYAVFCAAAARGSSAGKRTVERYDYETDDYKSVELGPEDYVRYMWTDEGSFEYQEWLLSVIAALVGGFCRPPKGYELVLLEAEG